MKRLNDFLQKEAYKFDKAVLMLSSGAFVTSLTLIGKFPVVNYLKPAWICFSISIIVILFSIFISLIAGSREKYSKCLAVYAVLLFNGLSLLSFTLGSMFLLIFICSGV